MGLIRLFLAMVVVADHFFLFVLSPLGMNDAGSWRLGINGAKAVMFFYVLSGFLIAFVLDEHYGFEAKGLREFYAARLSRIYSLYWPLFAIMVVTDFVGSRVVLHNVWDFLTGTFLFGSDWRVGFTLYPDEYFDSFPPPLAPAWTLGAEMTFYALAPLLLRKTSILVAVLVASFALHVGLLLSIGYTKAWQYTFFPSTLWFFLLGSLCWRIGKSPYVRYSAILFLPLGAACAVYSNILPWDNSWFLAAAFCLALSLPGIFKFTRNIDWMNFLGDLSYPVYLVHMSILYALFMKPTPLGDAVGKKILALAHSIHDPNAGGNAAFVIVAIISMIAAFAVHRIIEKPTRKVLRLAFLHLAAFADSFISETRMAVWI